MRDPSEVIAEMRARATFLRNRGDDFLNVEAEKMDDWANRLADAEPADAGRGQEPIGYMNRDAEFLLPKPGSCVLSAHIDLVLVRDPHGKFTVPLYTRPPSEAAVDDAMVKAWADRLGMALLKDDFNAAKSVAQSMTAALASQQAVKP